MFSLVEEVCEFSLVDTVVVHLLVVEPRGADELVRRELREQFPAQARMRSQWPILG